MVQLSWQGGMYTGVLATSPAVLAAHLAELFTSGASMDVELPCGQRRTFTAAPESSVACACGCGSWFIRYEAPAAEVTR